MAFSAELKGLEELNAALSIKPLRSALRLRLAEGIGELQREIKKSVYSHFSILENIDKVTGKAFGRNANKNIISVTVFYNYKKVPLSSYPVHQYRVTVGKRTLEVTRFKKGRFNKQIVQDTAWATYVKVKKDWKLVYGKHGPDKHGRPGFMGWLHTGGKAGRFHSAGIFERAQQATWHKKQRLPVFELYGPSFTQIVNSKEVQADISRGKAIPKMLARVTGIKP
jgi:hypothetical protein